jgi:GTP-binding protein
LLSRISRATPQIADYPFTTRSPNLGIVTLGGDTGLIVADLPGLIEGASQGVGLGHEFLRHVERTRVVIHLVEPFPLDGSDPVENYAAIRNELRQYSEALAEKPEIIAVSKAELPGADVVQAQLAERLSAQVFLISSVTGFGLSELIGRTSTIIQELRQSEKEAQVANRRTEFPSIASVQADEPTI